MGGGQSQCIMYKHVCVSLCVHLFDRRLLDPFVQYIYECKHTPFTFHPSLVYLQIEMMKATEKMGVIKVHV